MGDVRLVYRLGVLIYLSYSLIIVAFEGSGRFIDATIVTAVAMLVRVTCGSSRLEGGAPDRKVGSGPEIDPMTALWRDLHLHTKVGCPNARDRCRFRPLCLGRCRWDRRGDWLADRSVRDCRCRVRRGRWGNQYAQFRGRSAAAGEARHRRDTGIDPPCRVLARPSPRGPRCPCSLWRSHSPRRARSWHPSSIAPAKILSSPS